MPKLGEQIILSLKLNDSDTNKYVRATVFDATGTDLAGSPIILGHVKRGVYQDISLTMPNKYFITCAYEVFDDVGLTIKSAIYQDSHEIYQLEQEISQIINMGSEDIRIEVDQDVEIIVQSVSDEETDVSVVVQPEIDVDVAADQDVDIEKIEDPEITVKEEC